MKNSPYWTFFVLWIFNYHFIIKNKKLGIYFNFNNESKIYFIYFKSILSIFKTSNNTSYYKFNFIELKILLNSYKK